MKEFGTPPAGSHMDQLREVTLLGVEKGMPTLPEGHHLFCGIPRTVGMNLILIEGEDDFLRIIENLREEMFRGAKWYITRNRNLTQSF